MLVVLFLLLFALVLHCQPGFLPPWLPLLLLWQLQLLIALCSVSCFVKIPLFLALQWMRLPCVSLSGFYLLSCLMGDFFFYFWHHVMLLTFKDDNTTYSVYVIYCACLTWSIYLTTHVQLYVKYNYGITDGMTVDMCLNMLLTASSMVDYWIDTFCSVACVSCEPMQILYRYGCVCVHIHAMLYHYSLYKLTSVIDLHNPRNITYILRKTRYRLRQKPHKRQNL